MARFLLRLIKVILGILSFSFWVITVFFLIEWVKYSNMTFNEEGRYFDGEIVHHDQDIVATVFIFSVGLFLAGITTALFIATVKKKL